MKRWVILFILIPILADCAVLRSPEERAARAAAEAKAAQIRLIATTSTSSCRDLGTIAAQGAGLNEALRAAQKEAASRGANAIAVLHREDHSRAHVWGSVAWTSTRVSLIANAFDCPTPRRDQIADPAIVDFVQVKLSGALRALGRDPEYFVNVQMQRLVSIAMPVDRQMLFLSFLAHRAKNGPEILIAIVDAPLDQVQAMARLDDDTLVRALETMDAAISDEKPVSFEDALLRTKNL